MLQKDKLEKLIQQGYSQYKIANILDCNQTTVGRYLRMYGLKTQYTGRSSKKICIICDTNFSAHRPSQVFCSNKCQRTYDYREYIKRWLNDLEPGNRGWNQISGFIRRWLFEQKGEKCWSCGWDIKHPSSNKCPLEVDHIDGRHENNRPENLRLLCPNCHSLTSTYKNRNKGHGRRQRRERYKVGKTY